MTEDLSAHELLVQLKHGNIDALGVLYARYARKFYGRARNRGLTHEDAEDTTEKVFLDKILAKIHTYNEAHPSGAGWMWRICDNAITDEIRKKLRNPTVPIDDVSEEDFASEDADPGVWKEPSVKYAARYCAWKSISQEDQDILSNSKSRATREGKAAWKRFQDALEMCLKNIQ